MSIPLAFFIGGAIFMLSMVLYPYVFLTARASFIRQPATQLEVARALGRTPWGAFRAVALPLARPGIAVGVSLALFAWRAPQWANASQPVAGSRESFLLLNSVLLVVAMAAVLARRMYNKPKRVAVT